MDRNIQRILETNHCLNWKEVNLNCVATRAWKYTLNNFRKTSQNACYVSLWASAHFIVHALGNGYPHILLLL